MYFITKTKSIELDKEVIEQFIIKADCFTDAETQTIEQFRENDQFEIMAIKKTKITRIL